MSKGSNPAFATGTLIAVAATNSSVNVALPGSGEAAMVTNGGTAALGVSFSTDPAAVVAIPATGGSAAGTYVVQAGAQRVIYCGSAATRAALILATGAGTVYIERGDGGAH